MNKIILLVVALLFLSGCSGLAVMKSTERVSHVDSHQSLANFVRPHILFGDGLVFEVWDGSDLVGTLESGAMIQYVTLPGEHKFMIYPSTQEKQRWGYKKINLEAGEIYYLKPNTQPYTGLTIGVADSTDKRIVKWNNSLTPMTVDKNKSKSVPQKNIEEVKIKFEEFEELSARYGRE
ncbi:MAG: membrane lipoprotein lipid attachment site-containing protein [Methyloprofundus sp.]|nr:membrane lipoprotein lipid attachment site-containing protein [Methyloprofundus sp.]MDT8425057.1 membrane lipoprotein lipid attachment site-containing protein [Methyloprofundus sp.]